MVSLLYTLFAILGLSFLVFIHEFGHYWVARRKGMRVEIFSIGFGKPLYVWEREGVKWQIGCLPFGGYVKIAGMQKEGAIEPHQIPDGFFGKKPSARIAVAFAGPLVNLAFALFAFTALWLTGGREKPFSEFTHRIGWVDPHSPLYQEGVRPGDVIQSYDGKPFEGFKDLLIASLMKGNSTEIQGYKVDYLTGLHTSYDYVLQKGEEAKGSFGALSPARYLIFQGRISPGSPMELSGLQEKDRVIWADGEVLFSPQQLSSLMNESTAFLTVKRGEEIFQTKVPRIHIEDLKMTPSEWGELDDWQHEAGIRGKLQDLYFIPYALSPSGEVEKRLEFIDEEDQVRAFQRCQRCAYFNPLQEGDQILALDGTPVDDAYTLLQNLQTRHVLLIVERNPKSVQKVLWNQADRQFDDFAPSDLQRLVSSIGLPETSTVAGDLHLLRPVTPKPIADFPATAPEKGQLLEQYAQSKKAIESIVDPQKRQEALRELEKRENRAILGISLQDREVVYNPNPLTQFSAAFQDTWRTLFSLVSGYLHPKYVSGPVGIVQVVQHSWMLGGKEALFWMAVISLNLGLMNLLPIPVLDGGHIVFSAVEMVTKKPLSAKTMERMVVPFIVLLIGLFIYITYHDLARLITGLF